jgi:hypothetical protein
MNGVMPGPLWLAIASAAKSDSLENGTLDQHSKNDTVDGKMTDIERIASDPVKKGKGGRGSDSPPSTHEGKREGG